MMIQHFQLMARYNQWANRRLLTAAAALSEDELWADKGAFFGSFLGTMNHLLVGDSMWLTRFLGQPPLALQLDSILHRGLAEFQQARAAKDEELLALVAGLTTEQLAGTLAYKTTKGTPSETPFAATLAHVFNHQTHHRGQAHSLLTILGLNAPELDLIYYVRELG